MFASAVVAAIIAIGLNLAMALLRRKTTNIEKMKTVMKETGEWRKKYTEAIKKKDKQLIEELKKKQSQNSEFIRPTPALLKFKSRFSLNESTN